MGEFDAIIEERTLEGEICLIQLKNLRFEERLAFITTMIKEEFAQGNYQILLDMSRMEFVNSSTIGMFFQVVREARKKDGDVRFCCLTENVHLAFETMHLTDYFKVFESRGTGFESFV